LTAIDIIPPDLHIWQDLRKQPLNRKSNRIGKIASGRIGRIVCILLIFKEFPMELRPGAAVPLEIHLNYKRINTILPILPLAILPILLLFY